MSKIGFSLGINSITVDRTFGGGMKAEAGTSNNFFVLVNQFASIDNLQLFFQQLLFETLR